MVSAFELRKMADKNREKRAALVDEDAKVPSKTSYQAKVITYLNNIESVCAPPDARDNRAGLVGRAFLWDIVAKFAKTRSDSLWKQMERNDVYKEAEEEGVHNVAENAHFSIVDKVSAPINRFNADAFADAMYDSKYKVPKPITKQMLDQAKVPTKGSHTLTIVEKAV